MAHSKEGLSQLSLCSSIQHYITHYFHWVQLMKLRRFLESFDLLLRKSVEFSGNRRKTLQAWTVNKGYFLYHLLPDAFTTNMNYEYSKMIMGWIKGDWPSAGILVHDFEQQSVDFAFYSSLDEEVRRFSGL